MNQREKQLASAVGLLLVIVGGYFVFTTWSDKVTRLKNTRLALETKISDQEAQVRRGGRAFQSLKSYRERSLPADAEVARSQYKAWLLDLAEKQIKLDDPVVTPGSIARGGEVFQRISLSVSGRGTLEQLTELLYQIYSTNFVHHVRSLDVKPIEKTRLLEIQVSIDALVIDGTENSASLNPRPSALAKEKSLAEYLAVILNRNLFAPANRPPEIAGVSTQRVKVDESLSLSLKADDPDELDNASFQLGEGSAAGATLDSSGKLRFRSSEVGTYQITVVASDDGVPSRSSEVTFNVEVSKRPPVAMRTDDRPPPKPKPYFEDAEFAFVTAITEVNGDRELWLNIRTSGEMLKLAEGDKFEVKRLKGIVSRIGEKHIDVTAAGESRRFALGENLAQGQSLAAPAEQ